MADKWGDRTRQPLTARQPGLMPHFRTYQYKSKMKDALGSLPDPCTSVISTDCTVFGSEQSLTVCLRRWILPEQGLGWLGQVTWMPCIAQGAGGRLACMKHCLYYSSYPLDTGDRAAKCKLRAVKKSGVCVLTDRQLSLSSVERTAEPESKLQLPPYPWIFTHNVWSPCQSKEAPDKPGFSSCILECVRVRCSKNSSTKDAHQQSSAPNRHQKHLGPLLKHFFFAPPWVCDPGTILFYLSAVAAAPGLGPTLQGTL